MGYIYRDRCVLKNQLIQLWRLPSPQSAGCAVAGDQRIADADQVHGLSVASFLLALGGESFGLFRASTDEMRPTIL